MTTPPNGVEIPQGTSDSRAIPIPEGSLWNDEERFYVYRNGQWVELTDDT